MKSASVDGESEMPKLPELPAALMTEIFTRLGAEDIHRCKCVSRTWNSILCNKHFVTCYIAENNDPSWAIVDRFIRVNPDIGPEIKFELEKPPKVSSLSMKLTNLALYDHPWKKRYILPPPPVALVSSSNGVILVSIKIDNDPFPCGEIRSFILESEENTLYVVNPITREWVRIPKIPEKRPNFMNHVGFIAEVDKTTGVLERFIIACSSMLCGGDGTCRLTYFSSDTWEWDEMLSSRPSGYDVGLGWDVELRPLGLDGVAECDGNLIWFDGSVGLISWDKPFDSVKDKEATLRYFAPPPRLAWQEATRSFHVVYGRHIHCLDIVGVNQDLTVRRLSGRGEWSVVRELCLRDVWADNHSFGYPIDIIRPRLQFLHPNEPDTVVFWLRNRVISLSLETQEVNISPAPYSTNARYLFVTPLKIPSWPSFFSLSLKATNLKQQGMGLFEVKNFKEAINCYTRSITLSPNSSAYAHRANAFFKDHRFREAEDDCTLALTLADNKYFEAYKLRAMVRKELGELKGCVEDVKVALELKPDDRLMKKLDAEVKALIK